MSKLPLVSGAKAAKAFSKGGWADRSMTRTPVLTANEV